MEPGHGEMAGAATNNHSRENATETKLALQDTSSTVTPITIDFDENDPEDPLNWPKNYKWAVVVIVSALSALTQLVTVVAAPSSPQILADLHSHQPLYRTLLVSIWEIGEVFGPLVYGPLSEIIGRAPIMHVCNVLLIIFIVGTALSNSIQMLLAFRFLSGMAIYSPVICPGIIGDMFAPNERGTPMALMSFTALLGPVIGPIMGSYLGQYEGWRWGFWISAILTGVITVATLAVYRESYRVVLLKKRVAKHQRQNAEGKYRNKYQGEQAEQGNAREFTKSLFRPLVMLATSPIIILMGLYVSIANGYLYLAFTVIAPIFQEVYHFSQGASGLAFLGLLTGCALGSLFCGWFFEYYVRKCKKLNISLTPEVRLPPAAASGLIAPVGFVLFGWAVQYHVQWIVPIIGTSLIAFAAVCVQVATRIYVVDAFGIHSVSAVSATLVLMNASAAFIPLAAPPLYSSLSYGWGNSVLALIALLMVPIPLLLIKFGPRIRKRGSYCVVE